MGRNGVRIRPWASMIRTALAVAVIPTVFSAVGAPSPDTEAPPDERVTVVSAEELKARLVGPAPPVVVDVRIEKEFAREHIPGSLNVPWRDDPAAFVASLPTEDRTKPVVFYCNGPT